MDLMTSYIHFLTTKEMVQNIIAGALAVNYDIQYATASKGHVHCFSRPSQMKIMIPIPHSEHVDE